MSAGATGNRGVGTLVDPGSVVIVGLSPKRSGHGWDVLRNLRRGGFSGTILGLHPSGTDVDGVQVSRQPSELPTAPEVAVICTPQETVVGQLEALLEIGCRSAVVFGSGFDEVAGGEAGAAAIRGLARTSGLSLVGPNCLGLISVVNNAWLTAVPLPERLEPGRVGIVSQSGSGCILLTGCGRLRFSHVISSGNETATGLADYLEFLADDQATGVIGLVIEGVGRAERVLAAAARARARSVPIVALKLGRTELGAQSVRSHTGAIAGDAQAYEAFCRRAGIANVRDYSELIESLALLSATEHANVSTPSVAFVGLSGGEGALIGDLASELEVPLAEFSDSTRGALAELLPDFATIGNPLDATGALVGDPDRFGKVVATVAADPGVGCVVPFLDAPPLLGEGLAATYASLMATLPPIEHSSGKPMVAMSNHAGSVHGRVEEVLAGTRVPLVRGARQGLAAVAALVSPRAGSGEPDAGAASRPPGGRSGSDERRRLWQQVVTSARQTGMAAAEDVAALANAYGLALPGRIRADDAAEAVAAAERIGYPVVVKTASTAVVHKSDIGGVVTDLRSADEVRDGYLRIVEAVARHTGAAAPEAVVEEMLVGGVEAFVGCRTDPAFGPVIATGSGGVLVELERDIAVSLLPISEEEALRAIGRTRLAPLFAGPRGRPPADQAAFLAVLRAASEMMAELDDPEVEIDLNPVLVLPAGRGAKVVDLRIVVREA
ncbi:MAG: acetate--CoA ligase family protein [Thermoleophilia bacterium]|nr:acetate--CoA ligase family protein [Thermoleophilia bacterium]